MPQQLPPDGAGAIQRPFPGCGPKSVRMGREARAQSQRKGQDGHETCGHEGVVGPEDCVVVVESRRRSRTGIGSLLLQLLPTLHEFVICPPRSTRVHELAETPLSQTFRTAEHPFDQPGPSGVTVENAVVEIEVEVHFQKLGIGVQRAAFLPRCGVGECRRRELTEEGCELGAHGTENRQPTTQLSRKTMPSSIDRPSSFVDNNLL